MKNNFVLLFTFTALLISALSCSFYNPLESPSDTPKNKNSQTTKPEDESLSDKAIDSTVGEEKIGVPECDEIIDFFADQSKSEDDNFVAKAAREYALNKVRESFRQSIEENKGNTAKMAKECKEFKTQLDKFKAEDDRKKQ
ncbi:MAG: hypothetical protein M3367_14360 [Acidobacteriota bacterium]|nr:hypothetical protein [Acidobacteriota bacterium]